MVAVGDYAGLESAIRPNTRIILSESPTNPYLRVVDLERLVAIAQQHPRVKTIIDATFATPVNVRPLEFGVDFVVHSASKYLSGHNDLLAGVVVGEAGLLHGLRQSQGILGGVLDPHAAFLLGRGLKTLGLRVTRQNETAQRVAEFLEAHPAIERVWYPGLASHPDHTFAAQQMSGFGGVVSFEVAPLPGLSPLDSASQFIDALDNPDSGSQSRRSGNAGRAARTDVVLRTIDRRTTGHRHERQSRPPRARPRRCRRLDCGFSTSFDKRRRGCWGMSYWVYCSQITNNK